MPFGFVYSVDSHFCSAAAWPDLLGHAALAVDAMCEIALQDASSAIGGPTIQQRLNNSSTCYKLNQVPC